MTPRKPSIADPTAVTGSSTNSKPPISRLVFENRATDRAIQINGPVGESGWREAVDLEIRENVAAADSIQVNHAISKEILELLLASANNKPSSKTQDT